MIVRLVLPTRLSVSSRLAGSVGCILPVLLLCSFRVLCCFGPRPFVDFDAGAGRWTASIYATSCFDVKLSTSFAHRCLLFPPHPPVPLSLHHPARPHLRLHTFLRHLYTLSCDTFTNHSPPGGVDSLLCLCSHPPVARVREPRTLATPLSPSPSLSPFLVLERRLLCIYYSHTHIFLRCYCSSTDTLTTPVMTDLTTRALHTDTVRNLIDRLLFMVPVCWTIRRHAHACVSDLRECIRGSMCGEYVCGCHIWTSLGLTWAVELIIIRF